MREIPGVKGSGYLCKLYQVSIVIAEVGINRILNLIYLHELFYNNYGNIS